MDPTLPTIDFRDFWLLAPAIVLSAWGLVVLLVDLALARRMSSAARRKAIGWLALAGVAWHWFPPSACSSFSSSARGGDPARVG